MLVVTVQAKTRCAQTFEGFKMMTVARRDLLWFAANQKAPSAVQPVVFQRVVEFDTVEQVNSLGVDETTDLKVWKNVYIEDPKLWIGIGSHRIPFATVSENAFYRAWVRNEP